MKRAKVSFVYEGRGRKRTREEKDYISRKARIRARARKYGYRSSVNMNHYYFATAAALVEGKKDEHQAAIATAPVAATDAAVQGDDDVVILEHMNIERTDNQASHVNPFFFSTATSLVEEKRAEHEKKMVTAAAAAEEEDDDDVIIIKPYNIEKTEKSVVFNPKIVNKEGKENIVKDGKSGGSEFSAAIDAEAAMIMDGTMMEWEGEGPGPVWWEEQLPLTCTYEEEWMWGSQMGTSTSSSGLTAKDSRPYLEIIGDLGFGNGVDEVDNREEGDDDGDIWNLKAFKDITNNL